MLDGTIDSQTFRRVLGHYPTGVCAITTLIAGEPRGMIVGTFTSVSLDPPLVAFLPGQKSANWQDIKTAQRFCVNILSHEQEELSQALSSRSHDKFKGVGYGFSSLGLPVLDGVIAWIDCDLHAVHEAGDHVIAIGKVKTLETASSESPLLFFKGRYGRFEQTRRPDDALLAG